LSRPIAVPRRVPAPFVDGATHAVVVPISMPDAPALADHMTRVLGVPVWCEASSGQRGSTDAERTLAAEVRRPLDAGRPLRAVVVGYSGGQADLVVLGDRAVLDGPSLLRLARECASGDVSEDWVLQADTTVHGGEVIDVPGEAVQPFPSRAVCPGLPDLVVTQRWTEASGTTAAHLVAAVAVVLGRFGRSTGPAVAAYVGGGPGADGCATDRTVLLAPSVADDVSITALVADVDGMITDPGNRLAGPGFLDPVDGRVGVGVLDVVRVAPAERARPALTSPFPLTLCPVVDDGGLEVRALARAEDGNLQELDVLLDTIRWVHQQILVGAGSVGDLSLVREAALPAGDASPSVTDQSDRATAPDVVPRLDARFAEIALERADAVALTDGDRSVTYADLDEDATRLAAGVAALGVRPGDRVGICLDRSADLVAAMIAVLRASATYVPMDPAYPDDRLRYTADDAGLRLVITLRDSFPSVDGVAVVTPGELRAGGGAAPVPSGDADDAAYVIYTSGSTGPPKGVVVAHRSVQALIDATRDDFGLGPGETWTLFHSSAFDFSVWEIWGPLLTGARLVVVPYWATRDPQEFWSLLQRERVTVLNQTPSAFRQLDDVDARRDERLAVRLVVFGGEPLDTHRLTGWLDRYPERDCRLVNMFGITETTVHVTSRTVRRAEALATSRSVGRAIRGWSVTVRDDRLRPLPVGFPGEILVGGIGLAMEYLGRPELTSQRFVRDPWTGQTLYHSGDLGCLRPNGEIDHLGRIDTQVKLRGFRIELGEIAAALESVPGVVTAAVVVGGDVTNDPAGARLDAYVVLDGAELRTLRERAERLLPVHMVPATFTPLPALPLTTNGKLDVRALPDPFLAPGANHLPAAVAVTDQGTSALEDPPATAPRESANTPTTATLAKRMCALWQDLLGVPVALHDNFFELGGNSLLAVRLATAMRDAAMPALPLRLLYINATPSSLAAALEEVPVA
jgi:amino acid adenylation domain-containing protein